VVIVDTSVWIPYFQKPDSEERRILDRLLDQDQAAVVGVVLTELVQGCRTKLQADSIKETLLALPMKPLCREECKGFCPVCGGNRSLSPCTCEVKLSDPRLEVLRGLAERLHAQPRRG